jgi:hypothetical protein
MPRRPGDLAADARSALGVEPDGPILDLAGPVAELGLFWLKIFDALAGDRPVLIPEVVRVEVAEAVHLHPFLGDVLDAEWIKTDRSDALR